MNNIYWAPRSYCGLSDMVYSEPERLLPTLNNPLFQETNLLRCPSFTGCLKNTYVIRAPYDVEFGWDQSSQSWKTNWNDERVNNFVVRHPQYQVFSLAIGYIFVSDDENTTMEVRPATYSNSEFIQKTAFISGDLNIGKYLRATDCAFILRPEHQHLRINIGDPLFYVTFKSKKDTKINLNKFYITNEISDLVSEVDAMKRNKSFVAFKLQDYYNMYVQGGYRKRALKLIKQNLLD